MRLLKQCCGFVDGLMRWF